MNKLYASVSIIKMIVSIVIGLYVAVYLGPSAFGVLAVFLLGASLTAAFSRFGFDTFQLKWFEEEISDQKLIFPKPGTSFSFLHFLISVIMTFVLEINYYYFGLLFVTAVGMSYVVNFEIKAYKYNRTKKLGQFDLCSLCIFSFTRIFLVASSQSVPVFIFVTMAEVLLKALWCVYCNYIWEKERQIEYFKVNPSREMIPFFSAGILGLISLKLPLILAKGADFSSEDVGRAAIVNRIFEACVALSSTIVSSQISLIKRVFYKENVSSKNNFSSAVIFLVSWTVSLIVGMIAFVVPDYIWSFILGGQNEPIFFLLPFCLLALPLMMLHSATGKISVLDKSNYFFLAREFGVLMLTLFFFGFGLVFNFSQLSLTLLCLLISLFFVNFLIYAISFWRPYAKLFFILIPNLGVDLILSRDHNKTK